MKKNVILIVAMVMTVILSFTTAFASPIVNPWSYVSDYNSYIVSNATIKSSNGFTRHSGVEYIYFTDTHAQRFTITTQDSSDGSNYDSINGQGDKYLNFKPIQQAIDGTMNAYEYSGNNGKIGSGNAKSVVWEFDARYTLREDYATITDSNNKSKDNPGRIAFSDGLLTLDFQCDDFKNPNLQIREKRSKVNNNYTAPILQSHTSTHSSYNEKTQSILASWNHYKVEVDVPNNSVNVKLTDSKTGELILEKTLDLTKAGTDLSTIKVSTKMTFRPSLIYTSSIDNVKITTETFDVSTPVVSVADGKITATSTMANKIYPKGLEENYPVETTSPTLILATYDAKGAMIDAKLATDTLPVSSSYDAYGETKTITAQVDVPNEAYTARAFIWKNITSQLVPYFVAVDYPTQD